MFGNDLKTELKAELKGEFEDLMLALMETPASYDAQQLHNAMKVNNQIAKFIALTVTVP